MSDYQTQLRAAVETALDNQELRRGGTLYNETLKETVMQVVADGDGVVENFLGLMELRDPTRAEISEIEQRIANSARGTWAILRRHFSGNGYVSNYRPIMAAGNGRLSGHNDDFYTAPPTFQQVRSRMVGYEIFSLREEIERERWLAENEAAVARMKLRSGMVFKNLILDYKKWSTLVIESVDTGSVSLAGTRRGSKTRWRLTVAAASLEEAARQAGWTEPPDVTSAWVLDSQLRGNI